MLMMIGCRLGTEALYLIPEDWQRAWIQAGGRIIREATKEEGTAREPTLLESLAPLPKTEAKPTPTAPPPKRKARR